MTLPIPGIAGHEAAAILALPQNKLLVAIPLAGTNAPVAIARLNEDGTLDESFGEKRTGFVEVSLDGARISYLFGLDALPDGGWLIRAQYFSNSSNDVGLALVRQKSTGELDE